MVENRLAWFVHVNRITVDCSKKNRSNEQGQIKRDRKRPIKTIRETIKKIRGLPC